MKHMLTPQVLSVNKERRTIITQSALHRTWKLCTGAEPFHGVRTSFSCLVFTRQPGNHLEIVTVDVGWLEGYGD